MMMTKCDRFLCFDTVHDCHECGAAAWDSFGKF